MGVQLNIKDPGTVRLARELADRTGRSVTETIRGALEREHVAREEELAGRRAQINDLSTRIAHKLPPELRNVTSKDAMDSLYDEGLPA